MDSLVGTGSVAATEDLTLNAEGLQFPRHTRTLEAFREGRDDEGRPAQDVSRGALTELRQQVVYLSGELSNVSGKVLPLAAITELAWRRIPGAKHAGLGGDIDVAYDGVVNKPAANRPVEPEKVLSSLEAYVNAKPLVEKRMEQIAARFTPKADFDKLRVAVNNDEERKAAHADLQKQLRQLMGKLQELDSAQGGVEQDVTIINQQLLSKASLRSIDAIQREMEEFINREQFQRMLIKLESYTTLESFNKMRLQLEKDVNGFRARFEAVPALGDLTRSTGELKAWVGELNKMNSQRGNCAKDKADLLKEIETVRLDLQGSRDELRTQGRAIRALQDAVSGKLEREEMDRVVELVKLLPSKEEVTELRAHVSGSIARFSKDNARYGSEFDAHLEIIRRYDEVLSNKASKHAVIELDKHISEKYNRQVDDLLRLINENAHAVEVQRDRFDEFGKALTGEIYSAVEKATIRQAKAARASEQAAAPKIMGMGAIRQEGEAGIIKVLSLKADRADLDQLDEAKQSKEDAENLMDLLVEMNHQIQHVVVVLNETLKMNLIKAGDTRQARENRSHELMGQVQALSTWALKFDAKKRLQQEDLLPQGAWETSVDSDTRGEFHALQNAQAALKESIAGAKGSTQRRYRSPVRQKTRVANSRHHRNALAGSLASQELAKAYVRTPTADLAWGSSASDASRSLMAGMRRSQRGGYRGEPPSAFLRLAEASGSDLARANPLVASVFPGRAQQEQLNALLTPTSRSPPGTASPRGSAA